MKSSRRTFIKTGAMAVAATAFLRQNAFASSKVEQNGRSATVFRTRRYA